MQKKNVNLIIKGFVFKKFPVELKVVFTISIIINIACLVLNFLGEKSWGNEIFSIGKVLFK